MATKADFTTDERKQIQRAFHGGPGHGRGEPEPPG